jgi:AraC family transcriptional regulator
MHVEIDMLPGLRLATVRHVGPYHRIGRAFGRLDDIVRRAGLPHRELVGVYHDDPAVTPPDQLRSDAGVVVDEGVPLPPGLDEQRVPAGRFARAEHAGSYAGLPAAWGEFKRAIAAQTGTANPRGHTFELYRNTPMDVPEAELRTVLYMSVAEAGRPAGAP